MDFLIYFFIFTTIVSLNSVKREKGPESAAAVWPTAPSTDNLWISEKTHAGTERTSERRTIIIVCI